MIDDTDEPIVHGGDSEMIGIGDWVEHQANTNVIGIVIGIEGSLLIVRLSPSLMVARFHEFEMRHMEDGGEYGEPAEEEPASENNVIDFTKARELRRSTPTKGAA